LQDECASWVRERTPLDGSVQNGSRRRFALHPDRRGTGKARQNAGQFNSLAPSMQQR
jgi:hypothetical protein